MNGTSHALTGAAVGVASLAFLPAHTPELAAVWVGGVFAWSVAPDLDHGRNSIAMGMFGWVSRLPARHVLNPLVGGHRGLTHHPLLAPVAVFVLAFAASWWLPALWVLYALTIGMGVAALDACVAAVRVPKVAAFVLAVVGAAGLAGHHVVVPFLPFAAALGVVVHIVGDRVRSPWVEQVVCWVSVAVLVGFPFRHHVGL